MIHENTPDEWSPEAFGSELDPYISDEEQFGLDELTSSNAAPFGQLPKDESFDREPENSLMVVTKREEYCFLWDGDCLPELAESLLGCGATPTDDPADLLELPHPDGPVDPLLTVDHFRSVVRELFTRFYQEL